MIEEILREKREELIKTNGMEDASFLRADIDILRNMNELRVLKIQYPFPNDFKFSKSKEESRRAAVQDDSIYRILEYCVIAQPVLQDNVSKVFKSWRCINGRPAVSRRTGIK